MISRTAIIYKGNVREDNTWCFIITLIKKTQEQQIISQYRTVKTAKEQHIISHLSLRQDNEGKTMDVSLSSPVKTKKEQHTMSHLSPQSGEQWCIIFTSVKTTVNTIRCLIITTPRTTKGQQTFCRYHPVKTTTGQQTLYYYHSVRTTKGQ